VRVQNAIAAVRSFAAERQFGAFAIELSTPANQLFNSLWSILNQNARRIGIAKTIAGVECVLQVQADFIFVAECGGNAALRELGAGVCNFAFYQHEHAARWGKLDCGTQSGDSGADHQKIGFSCCGWH
jgi:hypothetical protein